MQKKATAFILLIIFLLNAAGFFSVYQTVSQWTPQRAAQRQSRRHDVISVTFINGKSTLEDTDFTRLEMGEYEREGHRYDVVERIRKGGKETVTLRHDSLEEELLTFLHSFFNTSSRHHQASMKLRISILKQYLSAGEHPCGQRFRTLRWIALVNHIFLPEPFRETLVPPPKAA